MDAARELVFAVPRAPTAVMVVVTLPDLATAAPMDATAALTVPLEPARWKVGAAAAVEETVVAVPMVARAAAVVEGRRALATAAPPKARL